MSKVPQVALLCFALACFAFGGCVIKTQKGDEYVILDIPAMNKDKGEKAAGEKEEATGTTESASGAEDEDLKSALADPDGEDPYAGDDPAGEAPEDFTSAPWWKKEEIKVSDLSDTKSGDTGVQPGELMILPPTSDTPEKADDKAGAPPEPEPSAQLAPEEAMVVAVEKPEPQKPEKRIYQIDKHIQPISASLWNGTYDRETSKSAAPARRAGMSKVKSAIESGYGKAYVAQLEKAISLDRGNGYAYYFLARGRFEDGDWAGSKNFADKSVQLLEKDRKFRSCAKVLLAKSMANLGEIDNAAVHAREATIDDPQNTEARILALKLE